MSPLQFQHKQQQPETYLEEFWQQISYFRIVVLTLLGRNPNAHYHRIRRKNNSKAMNIFFGGFLLVCMSGRSNAQLRGSESERLLEIKHPAPKHFFSLNDPRTEQVKDFQVPVGFLESDGSFHTALTADEIPRPLNILAFGTSQTWGHGLTDRRLAYPFLISPDATHVDNLALPATAADHPSLCLESMIPDAENKNYDLIMFEYPSNQSDGVRLLLLRLRERWPKAIIMFVHVWHFVGRARVPENGQLLTPGQKGFDETLPWEWKEGDTFSISTNPSRDCPREYCYLGEMMDLLKEVDGVAYLMDPITTPQEVLKQKWFAEDWHHLTQEGHKNVAVGVANMLRDDKDLWEQAFSNDKPLGSWSMGDQCYNWYFSGEINVEYTGAEFNCEQNRYNMACSLEIDPTNGGTVTFESDFDRIVPVAIGYITKGFPDTFPTAMVQLNDDEPMRVNPDFDRTTRIQAKSISKVTSYIQIGSAQPGRNIIKITPTEVTPSPFQLIGVYLCGACRNFQNGHMGLGALNMDNNGDHQHHDKQLVKSVMGAP